MQELFLDENGLVPEKEWKARINKIQDHYQGACGSTTRHELKGTLVRAITKRIPDKKFGLMFSGGVDSSVIAIVLKQAGADFVCYSVGTEGSNDLKYATKIARELWLEHRKKILSDEDIEELILKLKNIFSEVTIEEENEAVLYGVAAVELACIELAKQDGVTHFFGGIGSEEIFCGYNRHEKSDNPSYECWRGLQGMWKRDLVRDCALAAGTGITVSTPFLDPSVIGHAMMFPVHTKIKDGLKKVILREIAEDLGLAHEYAFRKKQAAQYGSKFDKAIERIAKSKGYKLKREYFESLKK